jgi:hypothetical protein
MCVFVFVFVCVFSAIISVKFRVCFNPLQMGMFLKGLCTSYHACLSFLCGEICKIERIKHTLGGCHSAKPKFWLCSPHRSAAVTQKVFHSSSKICISDTTNLKSLPSGQKQNCPHEQRFLCLLKSSNARICDGIMSLCFALGIKGHVGAVPDAMFWRLKIQPSHQLRCLLYLLLPNCPNFIRTQTVHLHAFCIRNI